LGHAATQAPRVAEVRAGSLVARPPTEGPFRRPIGAIYRRTRELSAAGRAFLALLTAELGAPRRRSARPGSSEGP